MSDESPAVRPGTVLVADESLYLQLSQDPANVHLLDDTSAMVVPYRGRPELNAASVSEVRGLLESTGRLVPNTLLIRSPYDVDDYETAEDAIEAFSVAKYHSFANVSRLLGAKEVRFVEARVDVEQTDWQARVAAFIPAASGEVEATREVVKKIEDRLSGRLQFTGAAPDSDAALDYLRRSYLSRDPVLRSLVDMRSGGNLITNYEFTLSAIRESTASFKSTLQLASAGPVKALEIGARFSMMAHSVRDVDIKTEVIF
ncbi:hypothetical protein ACWIBQ_13450 [Microbacterium keratanolyticum]